MTPDDFRRYCEKEPSQIPLHALRLRSANSPEGFSLVVADVRARWQSEGRFADRSAVLNDLLLLYGRSLAEINQDGFWACCRPAEETAGSRLWQEIGKDSQSAAVLGWHGALRTLNRDAPSARRKLAHVLERVVEQWPETVGLLSSSQELRRLAMLMEEFRNQLLQAAKLLRRAEDARTAQDRRGRGSRRRSPREELRRSAYKTLTRLARSAQNYAESGAIGAVEAHLVASNAKATAAVVKELFNLPDEAEGAKSQDEVPPLEVADPGRRVGRKRLIWSIFAGVFVGLLVLLVWNAFRPQPDPSESVLESVVQVQHRRGKGTGFLVDADRALIATNKHVVLDDHGAVNPGLRVVFRDERSFEAQVVATSSDWDLAILEVQDAPPARRLAEPLVCGEGKLKAENTVRVIGHPAGETFSVFSCRVTQLDEAKGTFHLDAPLDAGCSGAPVLNSQNHVVGVVFAISGLYTNRPVAVRAEHLNELLRRARNDR